MWRIKNQLYTIILLSSLLAACAPTNKTSPRSSLQPESISLATFVPTAKPIAIATATATLETPLPSTNTPAPTALPPPTGQIQTLRPTSTPDALRLTTATPTATRDPRITPTISADDPDFVGRTIDELTQRTYGEGLVVIESEMAETETYTRYLFKFPSDGLDIYGFMNVPNEGTRFPVAIVLHGYVNPPQYKTRAYTSRYADALAEAGYFVFHPNYRNHPPSDQHNGYNTFRVDYAIDTLNLIAIIQEQSQDPTGTLRRADATQIHLMGHSMGGGIAQRVITVRPNAVQAAVLYGSMSGDEVANYERIQKWAGERSWFKEIHAPTTLQYAASPINYLDRWQTAVSIHHGGRDSIVPPEWSDDLCTRLEARDHPVECYTYELFPHTFFGAADEVFTRRMIDFFNRY